MDKSQIFIGLGIFYTLLFGFMGIIGFNDVSYSSDGLYNINTSYTLNESHTSLIQCTLQSSPLTGKVSVDCDNGKTFNAEEVELSKYKDLTVYDGAGFIAWLRRTSGVANTVITYLQSMGSTISGIPTALQLVLFTPLSIMLLWLLIDLIVWITPFIGG